MQVYVLYYILHSTYTYGHIHHILYVFFVIVFIIRTTHLKLLNVSCMDHANGPGASIGREHKIFNIWLHLFILR